MREHLHTYLRDHIAGANAAIEVVSLLLEHAEEPELIRLLPALMIELNEDKATLESLANSVGTGASIFKESAAWIGARVLSLKIREGKSPFGAFEGLEFLSLGIQGKLQLWKALERSATVKSATDQVDLRLLMERAEAQHARVETLRLFFAGVAL